MQVVRDLSIGVTQFRMMILDASLLHILLENNINRPRRKQDTKNFLLFRRNFYKKAAMKA